MKFDYLKDLDISLHLIATGAGAGLQDELWQVPGSSSYLSGASFPYAQEEHEELLGFKPEHYCSLGDAVDLASVAYMKAYRFGGKSPVGLGITASVASERIHRGDHHVFGCIITDYKILSFTKVLEKGAGASQRFIDGQLAGHVGTILLNEAFNSMVFACENATQLATQRFLSRPYFSPLGKREGNLFNGTHLALMPGAFNPPHAGHFGIANTFQAAQRQEVVFEVAAVSPHKDPLTVQDMLKRAKLLQGRHRFFSVNTPLYLDKAVAHPGMPIIMGADAAARMLDPKWGVNISTLLKDFYNLETKLYISGREINGEFTTRDDLLKSLPAEQATYFEKVSFPVEGKWDISSTQLRNQNPNARVV